MTPEQKMSLVEGAKDTYGLNRSLAAAELPKSTWYYHQNDKVDYEEKYKDLKSVLQEIARQHPEYGRPRIMAELGETGRSITRWWSVSCGSGTCASCVEHASGSPAASVRRSLKSATEPTWWLR